MSNIYNARYKELRERRSTANTRIVFEVRATILRPRLHTKGFQLFIIGSSTKGSPPRNYNSTLGVHYSLNHNHLYTRGIGTKPNHNHLYTRWIRHKAKPQSQSPLHKRDRHKTKPQSPLRKRDRHKPKAKKRLQSW